MPDAGQELMGKIIKTARALPPMPQIIVRATAVLSDENAGFREIARVLETDQAMATRVLKLANSAYYGLRVPVNSVQQASALLGTKTLFEMITVVSSSKMIGKRLDGYDIPARDVWRHSLFTALGAKAIAEDQFPDLADDAFMAGLLHDAGMLILDDYITKEKSRFEKLLENGKTISRAESIIFKFSHAQLASEYLKKWKLPASQTHAIEFHHQPSSSGGDTLSYILHAADAMANQKTLEKNFAMEPDAESFLGLEPEKIQALGALVQESTDGLIASMEAQAD